MKTYSGLSKRMRREIHEDINQYHSKASELVRLANIIRKKISR
jgi:hypothetical protein